MVISALPPQSLPASVPQEVDQIAEDIKSCTEKIIANISTRLEQDAKDGKPLFVLMGETHPDASHPVVQILVAKGLQEKGFSVACGIEKPHNRLLSSFNMFRSQNPCLSEDLVRTVSENLRNLPKTHPVHLMSDLGLFRYDDAPASHACREHFLYSQSISTSFTDAATLDHDNQSLDLDDAYTKKALQVAMERPGFDIDELKASNQTPMAFLIRNHVMAERILEHATETKPDVYLHFCGSIHATGLETSEETYPYEESLCQLLQDRGQRVLSIPMMHFSPMGDEWLPAKACEDSSVVTDCTLRGALFNNYMTDLERSWVKAVMKSVWPQSSLADDLKPSQNNCRWETVDFFEEATMNAQKAARPISKCHP